MPLATMVCEPSTMASTKTLVLGTPGPEGPSRPSRARTKHINSRRLQLSISKNTPHRRLAQGPGQCGPNVGGRFAFLGARNLRIHSISQFGLIFPAIFPENSWNFRPELPQDFRNSHSLSGPNCAMQPRCAMRFESHTPKSLAMRKSFFASDAKTH